MRHLELSAALPASAACAWAVFTDTARWSDWGHLVVSAHGAFVPGSRWTVTLDGGRRMTPYFVSMVPGQQVVFETRILSARAVSMIHTFDFIPDGPQRSILRQSFAVSGLLTKPLWFILHPGMIQFEAMGDDLARRLAEV
jgi:hypothetical protein